MLLILFPGRTVTNRVTFLRSSPANNLSRRSLHANGAGESRYRRTRDYESVSTLFHLEKENWPRREARLFVAEIVKTRLTLIDARTKMLSEDVSEEFVPTTGGDTP